MSAIPPKSLYSNSLLIRAACLNDSSALFENYTGDTDTSEYLQRRAHVDEEQTQNFIMKWGDKN